MSKVAPNKKSKILKEDICEEVSKYITKHKDTYLYMEHYINALVVAKKKELEVYTVNENSPFQPYEQRTKKDYPVVCVITFDEFNSGNSSVDPYIKELKKMNAPCVHIFKAEEIDEKLKGL